MANIESHLREVADAIEVLFASTAEILLCETQPQTLGATVSVLGIASPTSSFPPHSH